MANANHYLPQFLQRGWEEPYRHVWVYVEAAHLRRSFDLPRIEWTRASVVARTNPKSHSAINVAFDHAGVKRLPEDNKAA